MHTTSQFVPWELPNIGDKNVSNVNVLERSSANVINVAREAACREGYEAGLKNGLLEVEALKHEISQIIEKLNYPLRHQDNQLEEMIFKIVLQLTRACLHAELTIKPELIKITMQKYLGFLRQTEEKSTLKVNVEDAPVLIKHFKDLGCDSIDIVTDLALSRGEFQFFSSQLQVDARVQQYLGELTQALLAGNHE